MGWGAGWPQPETPRPCLCRLLPAAVGGLGPGRDAVLTGGCGVRPPALRTTPDGRVVVSTPPCVGRSSPWKSRRVRPLTLLSLGGPLRARWSALPPWAPRAVSCASLFVLRLLGRDFQSPVCDGGSPPAAPPPAPPPFSFGSRIPRWFLSVAALSLRTATSPLSRFSGFRSFSAGVSFLPRAARLRTGVSKGLPGGSAGCLSAGSGSPGWAAPPLPPPRPCSLPVARSAGRREPQQPPHSVFADRLWAGLGGP